MKKLSITWFLAILCFLAFISASTETESLKVGIEEFSDVEISFGSFGAADTGKEDPLK